VFKKRRRTSRARGTLSDFEEEFFFFFSEISLLNLQPYLLERILIAVAEYTETGEEGSALCLLAIFSGTILEGISSS
jgi:hypothetical protein